MKQNNEKISNGLEHISSDSDLVLHSTQSKYLQEYRQKNFDNREWLKFVNNCKSLIRNSIEYKSFICYCKTQLGMTNCSFFSNINENENVEIEIHHAIFTLHDIVEIVMDDMLRERNGISTLEVCNRVMELHFKGLICVVPLSLTVHQLVHARKVNVHIDQIYGDLVGFIKLFKNSLTNEHLQKVVFVLEASKRKLHADNLFEMNKLEDEINKKNFTYDELLGMLDSVDPEVIEKNKIFSKKESRSGTRKNKFGKKKS